MVVTTAEKHRSARPGSLMNHANNSANRIARTLAEEVLQTFGQVRLRAFGTSMAPSILPGDFISVQRAELDDISFGEVVLFSREGRLFIHRVVNRNVASSADISFESRLITRGDRLCHDDPPIRSVELLGRVVSIQRGTQRLKPTLPRGRWRQLVASVLRASDLATCLFIHVLAWRRFIFSERTTACQV
jgi:hypothetical protein